MTTVPRELLVRARTPQLLAAACGDWCIIGLAWLAMAFLPGWLYPVWALVVGGRLHALATVTHDATHLGRRERQRPLMLLVEVLAAWPVATTVPAMRAHHLRHHRRTNLVTDPYFWPWLRRGRHAYVVAWLLMMLVYPHWVIRAFSGVLARLVPAVRRFYTERTLFRYEEIDERELVACARADTKLALALLAVAAATFRWPGVMVTYYFIPVAVTMALNGYRFLTEHNVADVPDASPASVLRSTRNSVNTWFQRHFVAPHALGYHILHHLHPEVTYRALPRLHRWYMANAPEYRSAVGAVPLAVMGSRGP